MPGSRKSSFGETTQNRLGRPGDEQAEADRRNSSGFVNRKGGFRRGAPQGRRRPGVSRHVGAYATAEKARDKRHRKHPQPSAPRRGANLPALLTEPGGMLLPT